MLKTSKNRSFIQLNQVSNPSELWFCFHCLGGAASNFYPWLPLVPTGVQVYALQLPGREGRSDESFIDKFSHVITDCFNDLPQTVMSHPFVFYGHSMGALIAYEMLLKLEAQPFTFEKHSLVVTGCKAPCRIAKPDYRQYSDEDLIDLLRSYGGTPAAILSDLPLLKSFLPRVRADMSILNSYYRQSMDLLRCPIYAAGGAHDSYVALSDAENWITYTQQGSHFIAYPGGHFFVNQRRSEILKDLIIPSLKGLESYA